MVTLVILGVGTQWQADHSEEIFSKDPWVHILSFAMSRSLGTCQDDSNPRTLVPRLSLADIGSPFFGFLALLHSFGVEAIRARVLSRSAYPTLVGANRLE